MPIWPKVALNISASTLAAILRRQFTGQSNSQFEHGKIPANLSKISALIIWEFWKPGRKPGTKYPGTKYPVWYPVPRLQPGYPGKSLIFMSFYVAGYSGSASQSCIESECSEIRQRCDVWCLYQTVHGVPHIGRKVFEGVFQRWIE